MKQIIASSFLLVTISLGCRCPAVRPGDQTAQALVVCANGKYVQDRVQGLMFSWSATFENHGQGALVIGLYEIDCNYFLRANGTETHLSSCVHYPYEEQKACIVLPPRPRADWWSQYVVPGTSFTLWGAVRGLPEGARNGQVTLVFQVTLLRPTLSCTADEPVFETRRIRLEAEIKSDSRNEGLRSCSKTTCER